jgi:hypothetical protein
MDPRTARPPGLAPLDPGAWVACDPDFAEQAALRDRLLAEPDAALSLPEGTAPLREFAALLLDHLRTRAQWRFGARAARRPDGVEVALDAPPLPLAARLTQEDWLILSADRPEPRLLAGVLLFPARWTLAEKLGRPLTDVHRPVAGYAESLAARVNRVFAALRPDRPLIRVNWLIHHDPTLPQPQREGADPPPAAPGARLWLRTERQTLRRLPATGGAVFGIKTMVVPLDALDPEQRAGLAAALREEAGPVASHASGEPTRRAALAALAPSAADDPTHGRR